MSEEEAKNFFEFEILDKLYKDENNIKCAKARIIKIAYIGDMEGQYLLFTNAAIKTNSSIMVHNEKGFNVKNFNQIFY